MTAAEFKKEEQLDFIIENVKRWIATQVKPARMHSVPMNILEVEALFQYIELLEKENAV